MLHILFLILKIIGILLAVLLGLILLAVCIVLFVPVCYRGNVQGDLNRRELDVHAKVSWLFGLVRAVFTLRDGKTDMAICIAWKRIGEEKEEKRDEHVKTESKAESRTTHHVEPEVGSQKIQPMEKVEKGTPPDSQKVSEEPGISGRAEKKHAQSAKVRQESTEEKKHEKKPDKDDSDDRSKIEKIADKIKCTFDRFCDKMNKITEKKEELTEKKEKLTDFLRDEMHRKAFGKLKQEGVRLAKKLIPKRIEGNVTFGFEDPSLTGKALAWISILYPWIGEHTDITPDFEERKLCGNLRIQGRVHVITPVAAAARLIMCKAIRRSFKDIRSFKL